MSKVEFIDNKKSNEWKPWVTVTLSKREAANIHALLGACVGDDVTYTLFSDLADALNGGKGWGAGPAVSIEGCKQAFKDLDEKYGKV